MHSSFRRLLSIIQQFNPFRTGYPSAPFHHPDPDLRIHLQKRSATSFSDSSKRHRECEIWVQLMIRLAIQQLQNLQDSHLRTVFFLHSSQQPPPHIECWISSDEGMTPCNLKTGHLIGLLSEKDWNSCWPIIVRELERISTNMSTTESDPCCAIISTPQYPGIVVNSSDSRKMVAWRIATLSKPEARPATPRLRAIGTSERAYLRLVRK